MRRLTLFLVLALTAGGCSPGAVKVESVTSTDAASAQDVTAGRADGSKSIGDKEWGADPGEQNRLDFVSSCTAGGVPDRFCQCWYAEIEAALEFETVYELLREHTDESGALSEELRALGEPCFQPQDRNAAVITDRAFVSAANAVCEQTAQRLASKFDPSPAENVRISVDEYSRMVDELRDLPVSESSQTSVRVWLATWDAFIDLGAQYADDLEAAGDRFIEMGAEADRLNHALNTIADLSGMPACEL